ncbi:MAG: hypothetical protein AAF726_21825 [Planctomycetota bacterium]
MTTKLTLVGWLALCTPAATQVAGEWNASNGLLPPDVVPAWSTLASGACGATSVTLSPVALTIDDETPCPDDVLVYSLATQPGMEPLVEHRLEARMRVVRSTSTEQEGGVALLGIAPSNGCPWFVFLDADEVELFGGDQIIGATSIDTTVMRTYRIQVNATTGVCILFVDGLPTIGGGVQVPPCSAPSSPRTVLFGNGSNRQGGVTEWEFVRHNTGVGEVVYCADALTTNSLGLIARTAFTGSRRVASNDLVLQSDRLPIGSFGYYLCSRAFAAPMPLGGSQAVLCLGGPIGRFNRPGEIVVADTRGAVRLPIDLTDLPGPSGSLAVQPGDTWHFQYWYRDANPGSTSNTSPGLQIAFD